MIPKIIHQVHFGGKPSEEITGFMRSVWVHHTDWKIMIWTEDDLGSLHLDIRDLMDKCGNFASVSNIVRLMAVAMHGGIYLDTDCEVLKPMDELLECEAFAAFQDAGRICNAVFAAERNHRWILWQLDNVKRLLSHDAAEGVYLMSEAPRDGVTIVPTSYFYPFDYHTPLDLRMAKPDSFLLHHWLGSWIDRKPN